MANWDHYDILLKGVKAWNAWRRKHPKIKPDLGNTTLKGKNLNSINFSNTYLDNSVLSNTKLVGANLQNANLYNADLRNAKFGRANLQNANLYNCDAQKANFEKANLRKANLQRGLYQNTIFRNANLDLTILYEGCFEKADLTHDSIQKADLGNAKMDRAVLKGVKFNGSKLDSVSLRYCDLSTCTFKNATMDKIVLENSNLKGVNLSGIRMAGATFWKANLTNANLSKTDCYMAEFAEAQLVNADLSYSIFDTVEFRGANLTNADLHNSSMANTSLLGANVEGSNFKNCYVYGMSAWDLIGTPKFQKDLIITPPSEPVITVDDLEVAQFVYLVYNNKKIRNFMNAFTDKNVLILGRFSPPERKAVLDGMREKLRTFDMVPIVFDFDSPQDKDYTETVQSLAGMSMFVIVDVTNPKSTPLEMEATVKQFKIPYLPIIDISVDDRPFAMMVDLQKSFHWVLPTYGYKSKKELMNNLKATIIDRAVDKHGQLRDQKAKEGMSMLTIKDLVKSMKKSKKK